MRILKLPSRKFRTYLITGRLNDVLALIQVLAFDPYAHRSESGIQDELQGAPHSAETWTMIAKAHPEFFRVNTNEKLGISLVARHVIPVDKNKKRELPPEFIGRLLSAAIDLHDRQVKLAERWTYLIPIWVALIGGIFMIGSLLLKSCMDNNKLTIKPPINNPSSVLKESETSLNKTN
jgi:hypothetical protein